MIVLLEMIGRGWDNFLARPNGPLNLRFYVQPTMAGLLALRAGIQDARQGRQGYLWAVLSNPERRLQLLHEGWRGARTPFLVSRFRSSYAHFACVSSVRRQKRS